MCACVGWSLKGGPHAPHLSHMSFQEAWTQLSLLFSSIKFLLVGSVMFSDFSSQGIRATENHQLPILRCFFPYLGFTGTLSRRNKGLEKGHMQRHIYRKAGVAWSGLSVGEGISLTYLSIAVQRHHEQGNLWNPACNWSLAYSSEVESVAIMVGNMRATGKHGAGKQ